MKEKSKGEQLANFSKKASLQLKTHFTLAAEVGQQRVLFQGL